MHAYVRELIAENYSNSLSESVSILYGGSIKPNNARDIFSNQDVDGGLIGGVSLDAESFVSIIEMAESLSTKTIEPNPSSTSEV